MQPLEAIQLAGHLRELLTATTDVELDTITKGILPFEVEVVFEAIEAHAKKNQFVNIKLLMDEIGQQSRKHSASAQARIEGERQRAASRFAESTEQRRQVNEDRIHAAEVVDSLSPDDRRRLEAEVLHDFPFVEGFGLIRHIAARAEQQGLHLQKRS